MRMNVFTTQVVYSTMVEYTSCAVEIFILLYAFFLHFYNKEFVIVFPFQQLYVCLTLLIQFEVQEAWTVFMLTNEEKSLNVNEYIHSTREIQKSSEGIFETDQIHLFCCDGIHSHPYLSYIYKKFSRYEKQNNHASSVCIPELQESIYCGILSKSFSRKITAYPRKGY